MYMQLRNILLRFNDFINCLKDFYVHNFNGGVSISVLHMIITNKKEINYVFYTCTRCPGGGSEPHFAGKLPF